MTKSELVTANGVKLGYVRNVSSGEAALIQRGESAWCQITTYFLMRKRIIFLFYLFYINDS